ncbi:hypothetical protein GF312_01895 [Candidatus Poribacteria bacterium]|nr:hypothetical protein [Candidatus Poribacteria bacterium]
MKHIAVDFAETLVKERPMVQWVLYEIRNTQKSLWRRLTFMINSFSRGPVSIAFGKYSKTSQWAAQVAYKAFKGLDEKDLREFINYKINNGYILNLNEDLLFVIDKLRENNRSVNVSIHSQGTCSKAIELFLQREDVINRLEKSGISITHIVANRMKIQNGKFTGSIIPPVITKHTKHLTLPQNCIFIGDDRDEKALMRLEDKPFQFINHTKWLLNQ